jgi:ubiquinone/menaquinone biosynthesis C-methylase UbiE
MDRDLEHGRRVYDWWARHPRLFRAVDEIVCLGRRQELHRRAADALSLRGGETVLDLACGPGVNFALLEEAIGPSGRLVALDYSEEMVTSARERALREGWQNVEVLQGDAARMQLGVGSLDGALCTLGLSVVPDQRGAIERVKAALDPGGRFVVLDGRTFRGRARVLNPIIKPLFKYTSNWRDPDSDLVAELERAFDQVAVEEFNGGSLFIARASKSQAPGEHDRR